MTTRAQITVCCIAPVWLDPQGEPRCTWCGHRQPVAGVPPVESRKRPPWTWPRELWYRRLARTGHNRQED